MSRVIGSYDSNSSTLKEQIQLSNSVLNMSYQQVHTQLAIVLKNQNPYAKACSLWTL